MDWLHTPCTAFQGPRCIASGALQTVALQAKTAVDESADRPGAQPVWIFNDQTSEIIELDWRGSKADFQVHLQRCAQAFGQAQTAALEPSNTSEPDTPSTEATRGPGRPKLGVVAREVTLLPRHWQWLSGQPGCASVALRKLVEQAARAGQNSDRVRQSIAVAYKFMVTMAGHEPDFEEASRCLFAKDQAGLQARMATWPTDVQNHLTKLLAPAFAPEC